MNFEPPLLPARLTRRYKRFLADIDPPQNGALTIHCPNTGSMKNCWTEGDRIWMQDSNNPKRKYRYTWELVETAEGDFIGINTHRANALVAEALAADRIPALRGHTGIRREVPYGDENSRIDFLLEFDDAPCYLEVKSVTLKESDGIGYFPDTVSTRGQKHLRELMALKQAGCRAVLLFCVQHTGISRVRPADHLDPAYGKLLRSAAAAGVEILAWSTHITPDRIEPGAEIPVDLQTDTTLA